MYKYAINLFLFVAIITIASLQVQKIQWFLALSTEHLNVLLFCHAFLKQTSAKVHLNFLYLKEIYVRAISPVQGWWLFSTQSGFGLDLDSQVFSVSLIFLVALFFM